MTIGKAVALTIRTFVSKVMSLLFNIMSRFVLVFLKEQESFNIMIAVTVRSDFGHAGTPILGFQSVIYRLKKKKKKNPRPKSADQLFTSVFFRPCPAGLIGFSQCLLTPVPAIRVGAGSGLIGEASLASASMCI